MRFERRRHLAGIYSSPARVTTITRARSVAKSTVLARRKTMIDDVADGNVEAKVNEIVDLLNTDIEVRAYGLLTNFVRLRDAGAPGVPTANMGLQGSEGHALTWLLGHGYMADVDGITAITDAGVSYVQSVQEKLVPA